MRILLIFFYTTTAILAQCFLDQEGIEVLHFGEDSVSTDDFSVEWSYGYGFNEDEIDIADDEADYTIFDDTVFDDTLDDDDDNEFDKDRYVKKSLDGFYPNECDNKYTIMLVPIHRNSCQTLSDGGYLDPLFSTIVTGQTSYLDVPTSKMTAFAPGETSNVDFVFYSGDYSDLEMCFSTSLFVYAPATTAAMATAFATATAKMMATEASHDLPAPTSTPDETERKNTVSLEASNNIHAELGKAQTDFDSRAMPAATNYGLSGWFKGSALVFVAGSVYWGLSRKRTIRLGR